MQWKNTQTPVLSWSDATVFMYGERRGKKPKQCGYSSGICYLLPQDLNELNAMYISSLWTIFRVLKPHCIYRELLGMDSSMIPLLGFPFISMRADRAANIFLSDKSTSPSSYKT